MKGHFEIVERFPHIRGATIWRWVPSDEAAPPWMLTAVEVALFLGIAALGFLP